MTTIIVDFANKKIIADKRTTNEKSVCDTTPLGIFFGKQINSSSLYHLGNSTNKIRQINNGGDSVRWFVGAGYRSNLEELFNFKYYDIFPKKLTKSGDEAFIIRQRKDGLLEVLIYQTKPVKSFWRNSKFEWRLDRVLIKGDGYLTTGSGSEYADACLKCGKSPEETINIVSQLDPYTSDLYDVVDLTKGKSQ